MTVDSAILRPLTLGMPWETLDPFLFCVHHLDHYPAGNGSLGPAAPLHGRNLGQDFGGKDGWSMYHGAEVPGFPRHPHRGFETITIVRQGLVDHADSLGATARFGHGDVQWMTAGQGVEHSEMFPLVREDADNPLELFQIWLNLPRDAKTEPAHFTMFWGEQIPVWERDGARVRVIAGAPLAASGFASASALRSPPPASWASQEGSEVGILTITLEPGSSVTLPAASEGVKRALYGFSGATLKVDGEALALPAAWELRDRAAVRIEAAEAGADLLYLQGRPIGEPVVQHGPFVMNTVGEIRQAMVDYQRGAFGAWPWPSPAPHHGASALRFAKHGEGDEERPPSGSAPPFAS